MSKYYIVEVDKEAHEAIIDIAVSLSDRDIQFIPSKRDSEFVLRVFWYPTTYDVGDNNISLAGLFCSNIKKETNLSRPIKTSNGYFSYHLYAVVHDVQKRQVRIGDVNITLDTPFPKDIRVGELVSFDVLRLDW